MSGVYDKICTYQCHKMCEIITVRYIHVGVLLYFFPGLPANVSIVSGIIVAYADLTVCIRMITLLTTGTLVGRPGNEANKYQCYPQ